MYVRNTAKVNERWYINRSSLCTVNHIAIFTIPAVACAKVPSHLCPVHTTHLRTVPIRSGLVSKAEINGITIAYQGTVILLILIITTKSDRTGMVLKCAV